MNSSNIRTGLTAEEIRQACDNFALGRLKVSLPRHLFCALTVRDRLSVTLSEHDKWRRGKRAPGRLSSAEFLPDRTLANNLLNLGVTEVARGRCTGSAALDEILAGRSPDRQRWT
jgi:hypothetical protein